MDMEVSKQRLADVARLWQQGGVSVVPILPNRTKRPACRWGEYQVTAQTLNQVNEWWGNGVAYGLALICGTVSGNLEMTEIEGRACDGNSLTEVANRMDELGIGHVWDLLNGPNGYSEMSPSGGLHLLYRVSDHEVPGNTKIAMGEDGLVLAETRGTGGYVIVAPTPGSCHPSGEAWVMINGAYGALPVITWQERCLLHEALARALDATRQLDTRQFASDTPSHARPNTPADYPRPHAPVLDDSAGQLLPGPTPQIPAALPLDWSSAAGLSPGDHFEQATDWAEILEPHGWTLNSRQGPERHWTRPGKDRRDGSSATTGRAADRDRLYVFSTSTPFDTEVPYTKFGAYALLNFGGNFHLAASELARRGYGFREAPGTELDLLHVPAPPDTAPAYPRSDDGNVRYLFDHIEGRFRYLVEEKEFVLWDGQRWVIDVRGELEATWLDLVEANRLEALRTGDEAGAKWWTNCGNRSRITPAIQGLKAKRGFSITAAEMDQDSSLINLENGILNLETFELKPHAPERYMTKMMGAKLDPDATCPNFISFMERVLPDPGLRAYVQRSLGYSLLGSADQRALFLICGPSGTGKSTLMNAMELLFGDYGASAPSGTLRAPGRETSAPSNDLHTLRGKRFVSTSETNESTAYNEDLIKRLTGRDKIVSRELYQKFQEWSPRCVIWLATNHPPKFSSDDDAIWRRAKIVPFNTVLLGDGEVADFAHNVLAKELDGILNWVLDGLRAFQAHGLGEPTEVQEMASEVRLQSDPASRFLEDHLADGILVQGPDLQIRTSELYAMYTEWARRTGERSLGSRRFNNRLRSGYPFGETKVAGNYLWTGLGRATGAGVLGLIHAGAWVPD